MADHTGTLKRESAPGRVSRVRFPGVELSGRYHFTRRFFADYGYTIQSAIYNGVSNTILAANPFLINEAQIAGVPLICDRVAVIEAGRIVETATPSSLMRAPQSATARAFFSGDAAPRTVIAT